MRSADLVRVVVTVEFLGEDVELHTGLMPDYIADLFLMELARGPDLKILRARKQPIVED